MAAAEWFIVVKGTEQGPVSAAKLRELVAAGKIKPDRLLRRADQAEPVPAGKVKGLFPDQPSPAVLDPAVPNPKKSGKLPLVFFVVAADGSEQGPYDVDRLRSLAATGRIKPDTRLRNIALDYTNSARRVKGLFSEAELIARPDPKEQEPPLPVAAPVPVKAAPEETAPPPVLPPEDEGFALPALTPDDLTPYGESQVAELAADVGEETSKVALARSRGTTSRERRAVGTGPAGIPAAAPATPPPPPPAAPKTPAVRDSFYVRMAVGEVGPYSLAQLSDFVEEGDIQPDDQVRSASDQTTATVRRLLKRAATEAAVSDEPSPAGGIPALVRTSAAPTAPIPASAAPASEPVRALVQESGEGKSAIPVTGSSDPVMAKPSLLDASVIPVVATIEAPTPPVVVAEPSLPPASMAVAVHPAPESARADAASAEAAQRAAGTGEDQAATATAAEVKREAEAAGVRAVLAEAKAEETAERGAGEAGGVAEAPVAREQNPIQAASQPPAPRRGWWARLFGGTSAAPTRPSRPSRRRSPRESSQPSQATLQAQADAHPVEQDAPRLDSDATLAADGNAATAAQNAGATAMNDGPVPVPISAVAEMPVQATGRESSLPEEGNRVVRVLTANVVQPRRIDAGDLASAWAEAAAMPTVKDSVAVALGDLRRDQDRAQADTSATPAVDLLASLRSRLEPEPRELARLSLARRLRSRKGDDAR